MYKRQDYSGTEKCGSDLPKNTGETDARIKTVQVKWEN